MTRHVFRAEHWEELRHTGHRDWRLFAEMDALAGNSDCPCLLCGSLTGNDCELGACTAVIDIDGDPDWKIVGLVCWACAEHNSDAEIISAIDCRMRIRRVSSWDFETDETTVDFDTVAAVRALGSICLCCGDDTYDDVDGVVVTGSAMHGPICGKCGELGDAAILAALRRINR